MRSTPTEGSDAQIERLEERLSGLIKQLEDRDPTSGVSRSDAYSLFSAADALTEKTRQIAGAQNPDLQGKTILLVSSSDASGNLTKPGFDDRLIEQLRQSGATVMLSDSGKLAAIAKFDLVICRLQEADRIADFILGDLPDNSSMRAKLLILQAFGHDPGHYGHNAARRLGESVSYLIPKSSFGDEEPRSISEEQVTERCAEILNAPSQKLKWPERGDFSGGASLKL